MMRRSTGAPLKAWCVCAYMCGVHVCGVFVCVHVVCAHVGSLHACVYLRVHVCFCVWCVSMCGVFMRVACVHM